MDDYNYNSSPCHISNHRRSMIFVLIGIRRTPLRGGPGIGNSCHVSGNRFLCSGLYRVSFFAMRFITLYVLEAEPYEL